MLGKTNEQSRKPRGRGGQWQTSLEAYVVNHRPLASNRAVHDHHSGARFEPFAKGAERLRFEPNPAEPLLNTCLAWSWLPSTPASQLMGKFPVTKARLELGRTVSTLINGQVNSKFLPMGKVLQMGMVRGPEPCPLARTCP